MARFNRLLAAAAGLAVAGSTITGANASFIYTVDVWTYDATVVGSVQADGTNPVLVNTPTYVFNYDNSTINWSTPGPQGNNAQNIGSVFIPDPANIQWVSGNETNFMNNPLSVAGNTTASLFYITASISAPAGISGNLTSDDGSTLIVNGSTLVSMPGEQSANTANFSAPGPFSNAPVQLYYEEANGAPAVLDFNLSGGKLAEPVPELSTWAMMLLGFFGVGFIAHRGKSKSALRLA
jgi:uncharacterized membrane protein YkgB